jgi:integrase
MAETDSIPSSLAALLVEQRKLTEALLAPTTRYGYRYDAAAFGRWCERMGKSSLPASADTVGLYVVDQLSRGRKTATAARHVSAIGQNHRQAGLASPVTCEVRELLHGSRRLRQESPRQVNPLSLIALRAICLLLAKDGTRVAVRNRAIFLVGFGSALRSASIVKLLLAEVEFSAHGMTLYIRGEKQDQVGRGRMIGIPSGKHADTCPVTALKAWIALRGTAPGPLFPSRQGGMSALQPERICGIVQAAVKRIGLDPKLRFGSHSMRSGFVTEAGLAGISELLIASQTGHRCMSSLRKYFRRQDVWKSNACGLLDL